MKPGPSDPIQILCERLRTIQPFLLETFKNDNILMDTWFQQYTERENLAEFSHALRSILTFDKFTAPKDRNGESDQCDVPHLHYFIEAVEQCHAHTERLYAIFTHNTCLFDILNNNIGFIEAAQRNYALYITVHEDSPPPILIAAKSARDKAGIAFIENKLKDFSAPICFLGVELINDTVILKFPSSMERLSESVTLFYHCIKTILEGERIPTSSGCSQVDNTIVLSNHNFNVAFMERTNALKKSSNSAFQALESATDPDDSTALTP